MVAGAIRVRGPPEDEELRRSMHKVREQHAKRQEHDYSHVFRPKTRFELIRLCCIIMGIEFAYSAETAFVSPTLLEIGINHKTMTMVWSLSPMFGFFLAPLMGSLSDRCNLSWGRRRPLILLLSTLILIGLILVPWGTDIGSQFGGREAIDGLLVATSANGTLAAEPGVHQEAVPTIHRWAAFFTILGTICLDFSADTCQTPARTYLLDTCISEDHAHGLSIFTVLAGLGGFMGYSLGGIDWEQMAVGQLIGNNIKTVFTIVTVLFVISCTITLVSFREIPLPLMERDELLRPLSRVAVKRELERTKGGRGATGATMLMVREELQTDDVAEVGRPNNNNKVVAEMEAEKLATNGVASGNGTLMVRLDAEACNGKTEVGESDDDDDDDEEEKITLQQYLKSIVFMPRSMQILCLTNLLSWMAHLSYSLYFTDFVGETVFGGKPTARPGSADYELYQSGLRFGCWGMAVYALSCSLYSMIIEKLIKWFGAKVVYIGGLVFYGAGMFVLALYPTKWGVLVLSITAGVIYATLFTLPYMILANYHASGSFKVRRGMNVPLKNKRGLGTDVAVISSQMFVAQIIISLTIGSLIEFIGTSAVIYAAGVFSICAACVATQVLYMDL